MPIYTYTTIDHPAATGTIANDINNADQIVGFSFDAAFKRHGYLLSGGVFTPIDDPLAKANGFGTWASGINAAGEVVGFSRYDNGQGQGVAYHGFLRIQNGAFIAFDNPSAAGGGGTLTTDINNAGLSVGYYQDPNNGFFHGFVSVEGINYVTLDDPMAGTNPLQGTFVQSINDADAAQITRIVGYYIDNAGVSHGFLAIANQGVFSFTTLDGPLGAGNVGTFATGINNAGQITGFYDGPGPTRPTHGFLYSNGVYTTLDDPLGINATAASGINDAGQIVGTYNDQNTSHGFFATLGPNPPPPGGTTAAMILRGANTSTVMGEYEIYNIGNNAILAAYPLGHVGTDWTFAGLGSFFGGDIHDMLLRNSTTGGFQVYDISNNNITNSAFLGAVSLDWQVTAFGNFSSVPGQTDMMMRNTATGGLQVYNIANNQLTGSAFLGMVGLDWQFSGVGNFSSLGESDMLLRNSNTGGLEVYDIAHNQITNAAFIGTVGLDWQFSGVGNFSGVPGESDLLLRNNQTGGLQVYNIANNQLTGSAFLGNVGLDWQFAGVAPIHAAGASDLVLRNVNTGAFQVYDITNNQIAASASLGQVGMNWQLGGFAADRPPGSTGASSQVDQLVQAMASFDSGGGAANGLNTTQPGADTSQQTFLTTPHA